MPSKVHTTCRWTRIYAQTPRGSAGDRLNDISTAVSGALHDSAILGAATANAMLFIAARDASAITQPSSAEIEDIAAAARVVREVVRAPLVAYHSGNSLGDGRGGS